MVVRGHQEIDGGCSHCSLLLPFAETNYDVSKQCFGVLGDIKEKRPMLFSGWR